MPGTPYREDAPALLLRLVLGTIMGLLLGVVLVVARWALSDKLQSEAHVRRALGDIPLLAAIPQARAAVTGSPAVCEGFREAFRHLRTRIYCDGPVSDKIVVVSSPGAGDGKTSCVIALAAALAMDGKRVLVIEADMHRPSLDRRLPVRPCGGLADLLTGRETWSEVVASMPVGGGRSVDVIAAGESRSDSSELLSGPGFAAVLDRGRSQYDLVLVDSPPFPLLSDALVLAVQAGRVISVLRLGYTARQAAAAHLEGLAVVSARRGVIVNDAGAATVGYRRRAPAVPAPDPRVAKAPRANAPAA
jgi:Mrp family chromosome partitioning ATPase